MIDVLVNNEIGFELSKSSLVKVIRNILLDHSVKRGEVSLAIIDDATMHRLNREHLQHDYPTDVLSFVLDRTKEDLDGEVIVSSDTATRMASQYEWSAHNELMLYFIHGSLHLVGYDDGDATDRAKMREQEIHYLKLAGIQPSAKHLAGSELGRNGVSA